MDKQKLRLHEAEACNNYNFYQRERQGLIMETEKLNNGDRKSGSCEAGFFYRRIGGTVYKIRVLTSENSTDTFSDKISHIISREVLTEKADYDKIELPQMSQLPEGSSA